MENMPDIQKMFSSEKMLDSDKKRPPLTINDTKIPAKDQISASDQKRPPLPVKI